MNPTCAQCRSPQCAPGWYASECTSTMDSICVQCPPSPGALLFKGCSVIQCLAGYYLRFDIGAAWTAGAAGTAGAAICVRCPRGSFCANGVSASPCAGNCTTTVNGADSALMCVESSVVTASVTYFVGPESVASLVTHRLEWPPYVATRRCTVGAGSEFTCTVSMSKCVAAAVFQWWVARIDADEMVFNITGPPRIEMQPLDANHLPYPAMGLNHAEFVVEPRKWGQTRTQYFLTLWVMSGVVFGMFVVACWMCLLLHLSD